MALPLILAGGALAAEAIHKSNPGCAHFEPIDGTDGDDLERSEATPSTTTAPTFRSSSAIASRSHRP